MNARKSSDDGMNNPDRCIQAGKDDGRDSQFSQSEFDTCGSSYEHGFMKECLSVDGNTRDVCNSGGGCRLGVAAADYIHMSTRKT
jgi:hypothetical protein